MTIKIVTDSTSDLPMDVAEENGIVVIPVFVNMEGKSYRDNVDISRKEFYERLPHCKTLPTTSAPGVDAFIKLYQKLASEGATQIISIHISSSLSNVGNVARLAAEAIPDTPITVFDSGQLSLGLGLMALQAARAAADGAPHDEIVQMLASMVKRTYSFALLDTLDYLRRGGRISFLQHNVAILLAIKPLLIQYFGEMKMERVRTHQRAVEKLLHMVKELGPMEKIALIHASALDRLDNLRQRLDSGLAALEVPFSGEVTPAIGTHVGPGAVGLVCVLAQAK
jgi:DegV family protein with EDD domain